LLPAPIIPAAAQTDEAVNREARIIFETVMSPYCPGRTISNCPSPQAEELRAAIKQQLAAGVTPDSIKSQLYAVFGDELRTVPRARGFGLLAWLVPGLAFLAGVWSIVVWLGRTRPPHDSLPEPAATELDPKLQARLDAELNEIESLT
jgi:cytochrome c-type biogenesis protein CcmH